MKKVFYIFAFLIGVAASGQQHKLKKADQLFDEMAYQEAADAYEEYFKEATSYKSPATMIQNMADAYYFIQNYTKAETWYLWLMKNDKMNGVRFNRYVQSLRAQEKYAQADKELRIRLETDKLALVRFEKQKKQLDSINAQPSHYTITNLPSNSRMADFGTAFYGGKIVYASGKDTIGTGGKIYKRNNQPFLKLYVAERHPEDGSLFGETLFLPKSQIAYHNATPAFANSQTVYFSTNIIKGGSRLDNNKAGTANVRLLRGTIDGDKLETYDLPFNSKEYSVAQPAFNNEQWLYFVSDMPGGYGETDIYKVEIKPDGTYGQPQNLGPAINTPHREMFPFIQNNTLYFASDGHYGMGGLDIFKSDITGDVYSEPQNLGKPINSNLDDFAFIIMADNAYGYFSSNRAGGKGDDDIYYFTRNKPCEEAVTGLILHKKTGLPLKGVRVRAKDVMGNEIAYTDTDTDAFYQLKLPCNKLVIIEVDEEGSVPDKKEITVAPGIKVDFEITKYDDLVTKEGDTEKITINPIFFEFDKWDISPQATTELDKVVYVLQSFPNIVINIESHTDSRGSDEYNRVLSANRAAATYGYIMSKGIEPNRIESVTGYGETQLVNGCSNGAACTDEEHLKNRRSEFIVVKK